MFVKSFFTAAADELTQFLNGTRGRTRPWGARALMETSA